MAVQNPYQQYKQNSIMTATPEELILMLYNGALKFINQGKLYIDEKNIQKANESILRAQDIIFELNIALDPKYEISNQLSSIYNYIRERLIDANIHKDVKSLDEVGELITVLRDTWKEAMKSAKTGNR